MEGQMPELRQNIITGDWVVVAPERAKRPRDFVIPKSVKIAHKENCPFCRESNGFKENEEFIRMETEHTYVVENRFPAFVEDESKKTVRSFYPENGFYRARASVGDHEVIIIKDHDDSLPQFSNSLMTELLEVIRSRYIWMKEHEKVASIMPIYNHGAESGASIDHPHAQIFASGVVSNEVGKELEGAERYYGINGSCIYCDILKHEQAEKIRVVHQNEDFIAFNFYASRFPFETWILPKEHESQFEETSKSSMKNLGEIMADVLHKIDKTLDNPPLNFYIHTLPTIHESSAAYHWHVEIAPRVSRYGGFELGSDVIINTMPPESAKMYLKGEKLDLD
jgi:UDPglucose--hexose-1-phosphate uridylyltransferase